ncbi:unnamed protein product [Cyprideis torosa]|uniref:Uncharacterized protein n=1 Tax=Cyprideis torosa TaxID=163714 RepID=A0A7R8WG63_9CRUS|nr:unnamed protein product [Cyprideis torosa]CAG0894951.1 unnamed protein product [Cyprideis torosa]
MTPEIVRSAHGSMLIFLIGLEH